MRSYHLVLGVMAVIVLVLAGLGAVAINSVRSLTAINDDNAAWGRVNVVLFDFEDQMATLVSNSQSNARQRPEGSACCAGPKIITDFDVESESEFVHGYSNDLRTYLPPLIDDNGGDDDDDDSEVGNLIDELEESGAEVVEAAGNIMAGLRDDDNAEVAWQLLVLQSSHDQFRQDLGDVHDAARMAEAATLTSTAEQARRRLLQVELAAIPAGALVILLGALAAQIRRREDRLNAELRYQQREAQAIVDCLPVEISWKELDHRLLGVNSQQRSQLDGWGAEQVTGATFTELAPPEAKQTWAAVEELERNAMETVEVQRREFQVRHDGRMRTVRYSSAPLMLDDEMIGVVTFGEDVTEAREMERALATSGRMESIGQLAAGVAHEINTPIQFVSDNTKFLVTSFEELVNYSHAVSHVSKDLNPTIVEELEASADLDFLIEEVPKALEDSLEGLTRVAEIVKALKDFSHPEVESGPCDLNRIVESTAAVSRNEWKLRAELELDLDPNLPMVECSEGRIKQVLLNMIVNAAHAIEDRYQNVGIGHIGIRTTTDGEQVVVAVSDDGSGMEEHVRERIFDQFFTTKEVGRGTGQGLSLAWDIIRGHGGTIEVDSAPGQGTTFVISLPLTQPESSTTAEPEPAVIA